MRSLAAHLLWAQRVGGSNSSAPTIVSDRVDSQFGLLPRHPVAFEANLRSSIFPGNREIGIAGFPVLHLFWTFPRWKPPTPASLMPFI